MNNKVLVNKRLYQFLAFPGGAFGLHKFYTKKYIQGILYIILTLTCGLGFFLGIIDAWRATHYSYPAGGGYIYI